MPRLNPGGADFLSLEPTLDTIWRKLLRKDFIVEKMGKIKSLRNNS